ncbi:putative ankyrin-like protein [Labilithrix luteola]|uniref:Putative ankyrin-like protein n=1 Tax=Labilithrix luteola TaxID=1391654 RepID=A0A0K1Q388_9BACT|nr:ankyrin repeat domain-containing protein [Labilithrix luteola]AKU99829.1 putative ankyrin-like protein [Labilithrix luteola]
MPIANAFEPAETGNVEALLAALKSGAPIETGGDRGDSPLIGAAGRGHLACVEVLIAHGAKLDHANDGGATALIAAAHRGHAEVVAALASAGANVEHMNDAGVTALFACLKNPNLEADKSLAVARALLAGKANPNQSTRSGKLPLGASKTAAIAELLVDAGAAIDSKDSDGKTALHHAARDGAGEVVVWLLGRGASADVVDSDGATPLVEGVKGLAFAKALDAFVALAKATTLRGSKGYRGQTALSMAAEAGEAGVVQALLGDGAELEIGDNAGMTPLIWAAYRNHAQVVELLLRAGAKKNTQDNDGLTARGHVEKAIATPPKVSRLRKTPAEPVDRNQVLALLED